MIQQKPVTRPANSCFSSGPCAKPPHWTLDVLKDAHLGRSHRSAGGKTKLKAAIEQTCQLLNIPNDFRIGIVPASDTGAFEMAMWSLLGPRPAQMVAWESFGKTWLKDVQDQLRIQASAHTADYGDIVDFQTLDYDKDVCFTWNGTTSGVCLPNADAIPTNRAGLTLCDATSAAFAVHLPWDKLDVTTFSWQKVLGGEAAHGMIILSPRAIERLETYIPPWPMPKIFCLTKGGKLIDSIFEGATINTPSMLCVEDYLYALKWAAECGGLDGLIARAQENAQILWDFCDQQPWLENLANDAKTRSITSVCLRLHNPAITDMPGFVKALCKRLESEGVAFDINAYRDAPAGLRIWCGATIEAADLRAMLPWLEWAYHSEMQNLQG